MQTYNINYYDEGGIPFNGTHEENYEATHTNGITTTLDEPTKNGYTFVGWYDNPNCTGVPITELSASTTYIGEINLYAKWELNEITLTLNCTNYSKQNYFVYIYKGSELIYQLYVQKGVTLELEYIDYTQEKYSIQFVMSYLGSVSCSGANITQSGRRVTINEFVDTTINYTIIAPNISGGIIV